MESYETGLGYFKTVTAIFKISEWVWCLLAFICSNVFNPTWVGGAMAFLNILLLFAMILILAEIIICVLGITMNFSETFMKKYDCIFSTMMAVMMCGTISSLAPALSLIKISSLTAEVVFTYFAVITFFANLVYKVLRYEVY